MVTVLMDKGGTTEIIHLELCKAFDVVLMASLYLNWRAHGFDRRTTWVKHYTSCLPYQHEGIGNNDLWPRIFF